MPDSRPPLHWMPPNERREFFRPFVEILDEADVRASKVEDINGGSAFRVSIPVGNDLTIQMGVHSVNTVAKLEHISGYAWFTMFLKTQCPSDFIGWLSMVKPVVKCLRENASMENVFVEIMGLATTSPPTTSGVSSMVMASTKKRRRRTP